MGGPLGIAPLGCQQGSRKRTPTRTVFTICLRTFMAVLVPVECPLPCTLVLLHDAQQAGKRWGVTAPGNGDALDAVRRRRRVTWRRSWRRHQRRGHGLDKTEPSCSVCSAVGNGAFDVRCAVQSAEVALRCSVVGRRASCDATYHFIPRHYYHRARGFIHCGVNPILSWR